MTLCSFVRISAHSKMQIRLQWHLTSVSTGTDGSEDTCRLLLLMAGIATFCMLALLTYVLHGFIAVIHPEMLFLQRCSSTQAKHKLAIMIQIVSCAIDPSILPHYGNHLPDSLLLSPKGFWQLITSNLKTFSPPFFYCFWWNCIYIRMVQCVQTHQYPDFCELLNNMLALQLSKL